MVTRDELLNAALRYAELGYRVFPCAPSGKAPLTEHGFHDATSDAAQIERWWTQHPSANIGIPTEGLLVIDIDGDSNPWPGDPERSADLVQTGAMSLTPRSGRHYVFRRPEGKAWKCSTGKLAPSVDVRTNGGYIVVPPSQTAHGGYRWAPGLELDASPERLPEPPAWLVAELDALTTTPNPWVNGTSASGTIAASGGEANPIPEHHRNVALASLAGTMRRVGMTRSEILAALCQVNDDRCRPRLEPAEVERIASSVARYEPDQIATAMAEGNWDSLVQAPQLAPVSLADLVARNPDLRRPVIHGLLRRGETMNVISAPKIGKALAADTPILTEDGWKTMAEVQPGMKVHAADGTLTPVVAASEIMHGRPCYRVTTRSGATVVADRDHLWYVMRGPRRALLATWQLAAWNYGSPWSLPVAALPNLKPGQKSRRDPVVAVVRVASVPVKCIQVAHPSGLFLAGRDLVVTHNSWLVTDLALAVATGRPWLDTFECEAGDVLIIDNELHAETSANRIPKVATARQIDLGVIGQRIFVQNLRGHWQDIFSLGPYFRSLEPGRFRVIILDAMYRFMPREMDENDNGTMANVYNAIDRYASVLGCCFVLIHHTSKGNQSSKAITDVGAGAGSQSRATDTHLILRPHEEDDVVVLEAAVRSWPPVAPRCLRWAFPVWTLADDLDPTLLRSEQPKRTRPEEKQLDWDAERFTSTFVQAEPKLVDALLVEANRQGVNDFKCRSLLRKAEAVGLVHRWDMGRGRLGYATQAPPHEQAEEDAPEAPNAKRLNVEALLIRCPELSATDVAARCGVTERYVRKLRARLLESGSEPRRGTAEQGAKKPGTEAGTGGAVPHGVPHPVPLATT